MSVRTCRTQSSPRQPDKEVQVIDSKYAKYSTEQLEVILTHLTDAQEKELVKEELTQRYYQHYLSLIATSPASGTASDVPTELPRPEPAQDSQDSREPGEGSLGLETDLEPIAALPPLTSKPEEAPKPHPDRSATMSSGKPAKDRRCFIATAAYGSSLAPEVLLLQNFRDTCLYPSRLGRHLVRLYYVLSPPLARIISLREYRRTWTRALLRPLLGLCKHLGLTGK